MKIVSFNVNSIRSRLHQLEAVIQKHTPDFIGLQETKVTDEEFPLETVQALGYQVIFHGQKAHYGVALLSKSKCLYAQKGYKTDADDAQRRFVCAQFDSPLGNKITIINGYFPQGESRDHPTKFPNKIKFYEDLQHFVEQRFSPEELLVVMGDMNISPEDIDIGIGEDNRKRWLRTGKCSFLPEERQWLQRLQAWGLVDTFRELNPQVSDRFSWFDYRSKGFAREPKRGLRIDLILATPPLMKRCIDTGIDYDIREMEKPSDHCPVWAQFE